MSTTGMEAGDQELARAVEQFQSLIDPSLIDALQPSGASAVYTPWAVTWLLVYQRLHGGASLQAAVAEMAKIRDRLPLNRRVTENRLSLNSGAYSQARHRLSETVTDAVADHVFTTFMSAEASPIPGRRAFTLDGTTVTLEASSELLAAFPPQRNQHGVSAWPLCQLLVAHEVASGCALRPEIGSMCGPNAIGEVEQARGLLPRLPAQSVVLGDRNFGTFAFVFAAVAARHDVIARLTGPRFRSLQRQARWVEPGTWDLQWQPTAWDRRVHADWPSDTQVRAHLHEVKVSSTLTLYLVTTLPDRADQIAQWYGLRADVETDIRDVKRTLNLTHIRCRSLAMLRKEVAMQTVAYNLIVQVRRLAARQARIPPRKLSFSGVRTLVQALLLTEPLTPLTLPQWRERFDTVLRGALQRQVPTRPGRSYPRAVLPHSGKYPKQPRAAPAADTT